MTWVGGHGLSSTCAADREMWHSDTLRRSKVSAPALGSLIRDASHTSKAVVFPRRRRGNEFPSWYQLTARLLSNWRTSRLLSLRSLLSAPGLSENRLRPAADQCDCRCELGAPHKLEP